LLQGAECVATPLLFIIFVLVKMNVPEAIIKEAPALLQVYCEKNHLQDMENVQVRRFVFY
jgi:hypothetical protein